MLKRQFIVQGTPVAKARARQGRGGRFYTPKRTVDYEKLVKYSYLKKYMQAKKFEGAVELQVDFYFKIPKNVSAKRRKLKLDKKIMRIKRPDLTNLLKSIEDGLNEVAYADDSQITRIISSKYYGSAPRAVVTLTEIKEGE